MRRGERYISRTVGRSEGRVRCSSFPPLDRLTLPSTASLFPSTALLYNDYQPGRQLPTSPPSTYLLVYFVVAVCYQVSTFATVPSSLSLTRSFRFTYPFVVARV